MKFAHLADCHLGSWRQGVLQDLNFQSFQKVIDRCILEKVDFVLIAGDLFDSAYPPIEILKNSFAEFRKLKEADIPVYLIAGSHDFSASGKTFLDVLEKAGFAKNVESFELQEDGRMKLIPTMHGDVAIYGYPGRKSGMEVEDLSRVYFNSFEYKFSIFMIHTAIRDVVGSIPMESVEKEKLPLANYYAMGHIHQVFETQVSSSRYVYPGPTFPNNFQELSDLKMGSFCLVDVNGVDTKVESIKIPLKEVVSIELNISNALMATEEIINNLDKYSLTDKIVLLKLKGFLTQGKTGDIKFSEIEDFVYRKGASVFLRNISGLKTQDFEFVLDSKDVENVDNIENKIREEYTSKNPSDFNKYLQDLMRVFSIEKNEDESSNIFEDRLIGEIKEVLDLEDVL